ncbi:hypothetical protein [Eupransor demetentiae]|uniref:Uncharacterized protein n=1 Tax=Eupransor demetentiae TaxID=3109584 RepID=A0ABM9N571_9LACO|nr:hypothetical protein R54876_GBNLAHCA_00866 [Lactobacillaceae bacterium LMG 33000]
MKQTTVITIIISLVAMFISLVSWILKSTDLSLIAANLATVILLVAFIWDNRNNNSKNE